MIAAIIRESVKRAQQVSNVEEYLIRLRKYVESDIRHQIKQHGARHSFNIATRVHLGFSDTDGFYQEISTCVVCTQTGNEMNERLRIAVPESSTWAGVRGVFHHAALKSRLASDYHFISNEISDTRMMLTRELKELFSNHNVIIALSHSRTGNGAVSVEFIQNPNKNFGNMFAALESGLPDPSF